MAGYNAFDPRLESLVVETKTFWDASLQQLSDAEKSVIAREIQSRPQLAGTIHYERTHTGFIREITVTEADIERLYQQNISGAGAG